MGSSLKNGPAVAGSAGPIPAPLNYTTKELKSKTVLCLKQFCEHCYMFLNSISYYIFRVRFQDCFVKVCLCSIL